MISAFDAAGALRERIRWPAGDLTITTADVDRFTQVEIDVSSADEAASRAIRTRTAAIPLPAGKPAYGRIVAGEGGRVWVSEPFVPIVAPRRWVVLEPGSGVVAQVTLPDRFDLYEVGRDYVLGRTTDSLGVERVELYDLRREP